MPQNQSSFQYADDTPTQDLYPDLYAMPATPAPNFPKNRFFSGELPVISKTDKTSALVTNQLTTVTSPLADIPTTQSLIAALHSTIPTTGRQPIVIPISKKWRAKKEVSVSTRRMPIHIRLGIVLSAMLGIMLISLITLNPAGGTGVAAVDNIVKFIHTQQVDWGLAIGQKPPQTQTKSVASVTSPALPPMQLAKSQYVAIAQQDAMDAGISPVFFVRQIQQESGFNPNAISPAGAVGIAQFLPSTAAGLGFNPYDPVAALKGAAQYMARLANSFGGDYAKALAAYNAGSGTVNNAVARGGANWLSLMPAETQNYVHIIMG